MVALLASSAERADYKPKGDDFGSNGSRSFSYQVGRLSPDNWIRRKDKPVLSDSTVNRVGDVNASYSAVTLGAATYCPLGECKSDELTLHFSIMRVDYLWVFETPSALCLSVTLVLGEAMRKQVNRVLRDGGQAEVRLRWPQSIKETVLGTHYLTFLGDLLEQHRKYYPVSILRRVFIVALVGIFPSFVCLMLAAFFFNY